MEGKMRWTRSAKRQEKVSPVKILDKGAGLWLAESKPNPLVRRSSPFLILKDLRSSSIFSLCHQLTTKASRMKLKLLLLVALSLLLPVLAEEARAYPSYEHHHEIVELTEPSSEGYYAASRWRPQKSSSPDLLSVGIIVLLLKLLFLKAKGLGVGFILLLKMPIILIAFLSKLLVAIKAFKLAKLFMLPLLIPLLLPLLLGPLLLLPLLLPLLLLLPITVLTTTTTTAASTGRRRKREIPQGFHTLRAVVESEYCLERIACQMAASKQPSFYSSLIAWALDKMKIFVNHPRFESYAAAYDRSRNSTRPQKCAELYYCSNPNLSLF